MGQAWSDSSPVFVISSALDIADSAQGRGRLHEMIDQLGAAKSVTNLAMRAYTANDVQDGVARAFSQFASSRPRPAYLEIPLDLFSCPAGKGWAGAPICAVRPSPSHAGLVAAASKLAAANSVIIICGGGALNAGDGILKLAEATNASIITTTAGKGIARADHPHVWGYRLGQPETQARLQAADCILAIGTELSETDFWDTSFILGKNLIRIDIDPASLVRPHSADIAILGDAAELVAALNAMVAKKPPYECPAAPALRRHTLAHNTCQGAHGDP